MNENGAMVHFRGLNEFRATFEKTKTVLFLKPSRSDGSLKYIVKYFEIEANERISQRSIPVSIVWYRDFGESRFRVLLEKLITDNTLDIFEQIKVIYDAPMEPIELALLRVKFREGKLVFIMDNIEYIESTSLCTQTQLTDKLLELLSGVKEPVENSGIKPSKQIIASNTSFASARMERLNCMAFFFEQRAFDGSEKCDQFVGDQKLKSSVVLSLEEFNRE